MARRARIGATFKENTTVNLARLNKECQANLLGVLKKSAYELRDLARRNAPVDTGATEDAIVVEEPRRNGINGAYTFNVGVNRELHERLASERKINWKPHPYFDAWLHESDYELGEKSKEKNRRVRREDRRARVGNKFLERASNSLKPKISREANRVAKRAIERRKAGGTK